MENDMLTVPDAARMLGIPERTLRSRIEHGQCEAQRLGPHALLITRAEVERQRALGPLKRGPKGRRESDG